MLKTPKNNLTHYITSFLILTVFLISFIAIAGCTKTVYVCATGEQVELKSECKTTKIKQKDAEGYAKRYVSAYFTPGGRTQLISSYLNLQEGGYFATFVVSEKSGTPYETVVLVDRNTGQVTCKEECGYVN